MQCVILVFADHTRLPFGYIKLFDRPVEFMIKLQFPKQCFSFFEIYFAWQTV